MVTIKRLQKADEIELCEKLPIANRLWGTDNEMICYGQMGYLPGQEWVVKLTACEEEPRATYTQNDEPVYKDSALEAFFQIDPEQNNGYINLELNSAGVLRAQFGETRDERTFFTDEQMKQCEILCDKKQMEGTTATQSVWWVQIALPFAVIENFYGEGSSKNLKEGTTLRCNFFKLSESSEAEHYASYSPIHYPTPNFHMPEFFADAVIVR